MRPTLELLCKRVLNIELLDFQDIHSLTTILKPEYKEEFIFLNFFRTDGTEQRSKSLFWAHTNHKYIVHGKRHIPSGILMYTECSHGYNIFIANPRLYKELFLRPTRRELFCGIYILQRPMKFYVKDVRTVRVGNCKPVTYIDTISHE